MFGEKCDGNILTAYIEICNTFMVVSCAVLPSDIERAHRVGRKTDTSNPATTRNCQFPIGSDAQPSAIT